MGVKQSKRSVDITETSTKGEIEGFGNEGKVEKIIDGVLEKVVAANGHVEGDLQNGIESLQNGVDAMQNGEAAAVSSAEKVTEKIVDELPADGAVNGQIENGEVKGEEEKMEEAAKTDEKKEKKKKDKVVKKKFSFRNFSFSKKDKSKPPKEEKTPMKVDEIGAEEVLTSPEKEEITSPSEGQLVETPKLVEPAKLEVENTVSVVASAIGEQIKEEVETSVLGKPAEISSKTLSGSEELPPPLPASPPPSEPIEGKLMSAMDKLDLSEPSSGNPSGEIDEVACSISSILTDKMEPLTDAIKNAEQIAIETGKQIEEKATNLLKTVEERAEESLRTAGEFISQKTDEMQEMCQNELEGAPTQETTETKEEMMVDEAKVMEGLPVEMSSLGSLSKMEDSADKHEEGAGESLADMPKDLTDEVTTASIEASNPESLEIPETIPPPPVVEAVTGE